MAATSYLRESNILTLLAQIILVVFEFTFEFRIRAPIPSCYSLLPRKNVSYLVDLVHLSLLVEVAEGADRANRFKINLLQIFRGAFRFNHSHVIMQVHQVLNNVKVKLIFCFLRLGEFW